MCQWGNWLNSRAPRIAHGFEIHRSSGIVWCSGDRLTDRCSRRAALDATGDRGGTGRPLAAERHDVSQTMKELPGIPLESLELRPMASGEESLHLTDRVRWEEFSGYAEAVLLLLDGTIEARADSAAERVWDITIDGADFWIAFDDFGLGISLDPKDPRAGQGIPRIRERL